ncbi:MAG: hypothetical protein ABIC95_04565, partial [archaeon]
MMEMNVLEKVRKVKVLIEKELGLDEAALLKLLSKLSNKWQYRKNKRRGIALDKEELALYDLLVRNCYNPSTVYKWLLLERSPDDIKHKLKEGLIGVKDAYFQKDYFGYSNIFTSRPFNVVEVRADEQTKTDSRNVRYDGTYYFVNNLDDCKITLFTHFENITQECDLSFEKTTLAISTDKLGYY